MVALQHDAKTQIGNVILNILAVCISYSPLVLLVQAFSHTIKVMDTWPMAR